jgi:hypothetical protein
MARNLTAGEMLHMALLVNAQTPPRQAGVTNIVIRAAASPLPTTKTPSSSSGW